MPYRRRTLREWRAYRKLSKTAVAEKLDIHTSTYTRMEERPETITMLESMELAKVFGCVVGEIIFFEENPNIMLDVSIGS
ncbi:helix-turn-helix transcriptional regulator [Paenibacillus sp. FSL H8-0168]|uniref:helix-turn-helix transcriptional regulator n=1 Tax=Paenibacillus sp. FSL H8-0168 TaxID=2921378 RepID=UPI00315892AB